MLAFPRDLARAVPLGESVMCKKYALTAHTSSWMRNGAEQSNFDTINCHLIGDTMHSMIFLHPLKEQ